MYKLHHLVSNIIYKKNDGIRELIGHTTRNAIHLYFFSFHQPTDHELRKWSTPLSFARFYLFSPDLKNEKLGRSFWNMKYIRYINDLGACKSSLELGNNPLEEQKMKK